MTFDGFYSDFLNRLTAGGRNMPQSSGLTINEQLLKKELERVYIIIERGKRCIEDVCSRLSALQQFYDNKLSNLSFKLITLMRRYRPQRSKARTVSQKPSEAQSARNRLTSTRDKSLNAQKELNSTRKVSERAKTPEFGQRATSNTEKTSSKLKTAKPAQATGPVINNTKLEARSSAKTPKNYVSNSPIKTVGGQTPRISNNKRFPAKRTLTANAEPQTQKSKFSETLNSNIRDSKCTGQKESKSSLSNTGHRGSLYELKPKSTIEKIKVTKEGGAENEMHAVIKNSIRTFRQYLNVSNATSATLNNRKLVINSNNVVEEFFQRLEKKGKAWNDTTQAHDTSEERDVNPLDF